MRTWTIATAFGFGLVAAGCENLGSPAGATGTGGAAGAGGATASTSASAGGDGQGGAGGSSFSTSSSSGTGGTGGAPDACAGSWERWTSGLAGARISEIAYDPRTTGSPNTVVAWTAAGTKLYRSGDHGATWQDWALLPAAVSELAFPGADLNQMLAASPSGVLKSEDGGATWSVAGLGGLDISSILVHPANPSRIYVGTVGAGVFRSVDGGVTWEAASNDLTPGRVVSFVAPDPMDAGSLLVAMASTTPGALDGSVFTTKTGGTSWSPVLENKGRPARLAACKGPSGTRLFAGLDYSVGVPKKGLYRSDDGGTSWDAVTTLPATTENVVALTVAPADCMAIYVSARGNGVYRSEDGGATFAGPLTAGIPFVDKFPSKLAVDPTDTKRLLAASEAGLLVSGSGGDVWTTSTDVVAVPVRRLAVSAAMPDRIWAATFGTGGWRRTLGSDWSRALEGLDAATTVAVDPTDPNRVLFGSGSLFISDAALTFEAVPAFNVMDIAFDPMAAGTAYLATQLGGVQRLDGKILTSVSGDLPTAAVLSIVPFDTTLVAGTFTQGIYASADGGTTWVAASPGLQDREIFCLERRDDAVYACVSGTGIHRGTTDGASWTWTLANAGIPSLDATDIVVDASSTTMYATTYSSGVFQSIDGATWTPIEAACLPSLSTRGIAIVADAMTGKKRLVVGSGYEIFARDLDGSECAGKADGTPCSENGGKVCQSGSCVACIADVDCSDPTKPSCSRNTCVSGTCANGVKDVGESDVDCGGATCAACADGNTCATKDDCVSKGCNAEKQCDACANAIKDAGEADVDCGGGCAPCAAGKACSAGMDCATTFCVDGLCCDSACGGTCMACANAKTGKANGVCADVSAGTDPDNDCESPAADVCSSSSGKCQCADGVKNGDESYFDCGGSCGGCGIFDDCVNDDDCEQQGFSVPCTVQSGGIKVCGCEDNSDCPAGSGAVCFNWVCIQCMDNSDCPPMINCVDFKCGG